MKKNALVLFLSALMACACSESSDESGESGCTNGTWKCDGNQLSKCVSEKWEIHQSCENYTQCNAETGSCELACRATEHLFTDKCEADDVTHCGTHTNDCTKLAGWKSGSCFNKECFAEECNVGYHLVSLFDSDNKERTVCEEDTNDACGSINTQCGKDEICLQGECKAKCQPDEVICDSSCINPQTDKKFCGADESCSNYITCSEFEDCIDRKCILTSCQNEDETICTENDQNICVDIHGSNPNHCGACGAACSDSESAKTTGCDHGQCTYTCDEPMINCGSDTEPICLSEDQFKSDPLHCGTACLNCNTENFASAGICQDGACIITSCAAGYILTDQGVCSKCQDICANGCNDLGECICPNTCQNECDEFGTCKCPDNCIDDCDSAGVCNSLDEPVIVGTPTITMTPESIVKEYIEKDKIAFTVTFKDGSKKGIKDQKITFTVDDPTCVKVSNSAKRTGDDGTADNAILVLKADCTATVTATASNSGKDYKATLPVTISNLTTFDMKLELKYENANRFEGIGYTAYKILHEPCASIRSTYKGYEQYLSATHYDSEESTDTISGNPNTYILNTFNIQDVDAKNDKAIIAWGAADDFGEATAVGCVDISAADANKTKIIELTALPFDIIGNYDTVANFDLTSAFPTSNKTLPPIEDMKAGDWVNFTVDLFKKPVETLIDFTLVNLNSRLKAVANISDNSVVKMVINFMTSDTTKQIAVKQLTPIIEKSLKSADNGKQTRYQILTTLSGDIEDLVRNMQFRGSFKIESVNSNDKMQITKASEEYKTLEYMWNYVPQGSSQHCIQDAYTKPGSCRNSMSLSGMKIESVKGSWTGAVSDSESVDGLLKINAHPFTFKWATILYSVVFGEILPKAMGYSDSKFVNKDGATGYRYITGFMNALVYQPIAKYYSLEKAGKPRDEGEGTYPQLSITEAGKDCERFIEAYVYLIYPDAYSATGVISVIAGLACGNQGLGQLDKLAEASLASNESSETNVFKLSANGCSLYSNGQSQYQQIGKPDANVYSADEVVQGSKQSMRCNWQVAVPTKIGSNPIKGLFHGVREDF